ncbi:MAG: hypothetical protein ACOYOB_19340 [Myxococcota bacterium]
MGFDFEDALDAVVGEESGPCLVTLGTAHRENGTRSTGYSDSNGRLRATDKGTSVRLVRSLGVMSSGAKLTLSHAELAALASAGRVWEQQRNDWAEFAHVPAGCPGFAMSYRFEYRPPGANSKSVDIGRRGGMGPPRGDTFVGKPEETVALDVPVEVADGVHVVAELWQRGERYGPVEGSRIGVQYQFGPDLFLQARRCSARAYRTDRSDVFLERGDEVFLRLLVGRLARD